MQNDFLIYDNGELLSKYKGKDEVAVIPNGVNVIDGGAFSNCSIKGVVIPKGVTTIKRLAFSFCNQLKEIVLPDGVTTIEKEAFCNLRNICEVTFPNSVTHVGNDIFEYADPCQITVFGEIFNLDEEELHYEYDIETIKDDYGYDEEEYTALWERVRFIVASEIPALLLNGNYDDLYMPESLRRDIIVRALKHKPKHENFLNMVKRDIAKIFKFLLKESDIIKFLIDNEVITSQNIDECIRIARDNNAAEVEDLLKNSKLR